MNNAVDVIRDIAVVSEPRNIILLLWHPFYVTDEIFLFVLLVVVLGDVFSLLISSFVQNSGVDGHSTFRDLVCRDGRLMEAKKKYDKMEETMCNQVLCRVRREEMR